MRESSSVYCIGCDEHVTRVELVLELGYYQGLGVSVNVEVGVVVGCG